MDILLASLTPEGGTVLLVAHPETKRKAVNAGMKSRKRDGLHEKLLDKVIDRFLRYIIHGRSAPAEKPV